MNEKKLKARDFITIGIFTAILWVVQMVIMYLGFLSPFVVAGYAVLIPIVTGIPMMLYYARIEKFGMLTITSVIVAILLFIFGMGFLGAPVCIAAGVIADLIAKSGKYKSWKKTVISCGVFNLWALSLYFFIPSPAQRPFRFWLRLTASVHRRPSRRSFPQYNPAGTAERTGASWQCS